MSPTTRSRNVIGATSLRAILAGDDATMFPVGVVFAFLLAAYSDEWTPGQREHFLDVIDREFPDVTARTVTYVGLLEGGHR